MSSKKDDHAVREALMMVLQFGISMLVPIFMCTLFGVWLGNKLGIDWLAVPFFFLGAVAGGQSVYRLAKKFIK
jgi:hypothetical protein